MQDNYRARMHEEAAELEARIEKAEARLADETDPMRFKLLNAQIDAMGAYCAALSARIRYEDGHIEPEAAQKDEKPEGTVINENRLACVECALEDIPETIRPRSANQLGREYGRFFRPDRYEYYKLLYKGEIVGYQLCDGNDMVTYNAVGECIS